MTFGQKLPLGLLMISTLVISCTTPPPEIPQQAPPMPIIQNVAGNVVAPKNLANLRYGENVKGYTIGRYIDPTDPSVMYEQHVAYRLEEPSSWNLQPNLPVNIPYEGVARQLLSDDDRLLRAEMETKAYQQRELYNYLKTSSEEIKKNRTMLDRTVQLSRKIVEDKKVLLGLLKKSKVENVALQKKVQEQQAQLQKMLKYYELRERQQIKSKYKRN
jgi:hypothetical protein